MLVDDVESSPQLYARSGGGLYLVIIVLGLFAEIFVRGRLIVSGDAAATVANIRAMESLWRAGILAEYIALVCAIALAMIYFVLLRPVSRELNLLATFLRLVSLAVQGVAVLDLSAALFPLSNSASLRAFTPEQLAALVTLAVKSHSQGFGVALLVLGFCFLIHGYLIFRSAYLPGALGILIQIAGVCYLTNSISLLLAPALANRMFPAILLPAFIGETSLCLWLLVKGVDLEEWRRATAYSVRRGPSNA
jgi:hypothetical protein